MLDTDVFSEAAKGRNTRVLDRAREYEAEHGRLAITTLTVLEVVRGYCLRGRATLLESFLRRVQQLEVIPLDTESAVLAGRLFAELDRAGKAIGRLDPMIAAIALRNDLTLATGNTQHFERVCALGYPLRLVDWRE